MSSSKTTSEREKKEEKLCQLVKLRKASVDDELSEECSSVNRGAEGHLPPFLALFLAVFLEVGELSDSYSSW